MDYLFFSAIKNTPVRVLNISYNIACQWMTHLWERMTTLPHSMQFPYKDRKINALMPKFHLPAHVVVFLGKDSSKLVMVPQTMYLRLHGW